MTAARLQPSATAGRTSACGEPVPNEGSQPRFTAKIKNQNDRQPEERDGCEYDERGPDAVQPGAGPHAGNDADRDADAEAHAYRCESEGEGRAGVGPISEATVWLVT